MNKRTVITLVCIGLMAIICFVSIPLMNAATNKNVTTQVVVVSKNIEKGAIITESDVHLAALPATGVPAKAITQMNEVVGHYAVVDMQAYDLVFREKVTAASIETVNAYTTLEDGTVAVTISASNMTGMLGGKIQKGDIVSFNDKNGNIPADLQYVQIDYIMNPSGIYAEDISGDMDRTMSMLTFIISEEQARHLVDIEYSGAPHYELVCRGNDERAQRLLAMQEDIIAKIAEVRDTYISNRVEDIYATYAEMNKDAKEDKQKVSFYDWFKAVCSVCGFPQDSIATYVERTVSSSSTTFENTYGFGDWYADGGDSDKQMSLVGETTTSTTLTKESALQKVVIEAYYKYLSEHPEDVKNLLTFCFESVYGNDYFDGYVDWDEWKAEWEVEYYKQHLADHFLKLYDEHVWESGETFNTWFENNVYKILKQSETKDCDEVVVEKSVADAMAKMTACNGKKPADAMKSERADMRDALEQYLVGNVFAHATADTRLTLAAAETETPAGEQ